MIRMSALRRRSRRGGCAAGDALLRLRLICFGLPILILIRMLLLMLVLILMVHLRVATRHVMILVHLLAQRMDLLDSSSLNTEGPTSAGLESPECASLAKLPHPTNNTTKGRECKASPALIGRGLRRKVEQRRGAAHIPVKFIAGSFRSESSAIVGIRVHTLVHRIPFPESTIRGIELAGEVVVSKTWSTMRTGRLEEAVIIDGRHLLGPRNFIAMTLAPGMGIGGRGGARGSVAVAGAGAGGDGRAKEAGMDTFAVKGAGHVEMRRDVHGVAGEGRDRNANEVRSTKDGIRVRNGRGGEQEKSSTAAETHVRIERFLPSAVWGSSPLCKAKFVCVDFFAIKVKRYDKWAACVVS